MTKAETARLLAILQGAYPRQEIQPETLEAYSAMLSDLTYEAASSALKRILATSKWFPTIAEIRAETAEDFLDSLPDPAIAWGEVLRAISRFGSYRTPEFEHYEIAAAVEAVGWQAICLDTAVMSTRKRFVDAYTAIRDRTLRGEQLGEFAGPRLKAERAERTHRLATARARKQRTLSDSHVGGDVKRLVAEALELHGTAGGDE